MRAFCLCVWGVVLQLSCPGGAVIGAGSAVVAGAFFSSADYNPEGLLERVCVWCSSFVQCAEFLDRKPLQALSLLGQPDLVSVVSGAQTPPPPPRHVASPPTPPYPF
eukprot:RCo010931